jgi:hypothetical protein
VRVLPEQHEEAVGAPSETSSRITALAASATERSEWARIANVMKRQQGEH